MPRNYKPDPSKKRYKKYDPEIIKTAVEEYITTRNAKLGEIAKKYNINKSVLYRHSTRNMKSHGGQRALSDETENYLIENINKCAEWGYPLDTMDLRYIIKMYLDKLGIIHKTFRNNFPGPDFIQNFLQHHKDEISQRVCENIKRVRAKVSPDTIKQYYDELKKSLNGVPDSNILNYDETNLSDDPGRKKILVKRGCKYPERVLNHTKASVSIMMAGTADGKMLPPYIVYKATHLYDTWVEQGPEGARYNRSDSGWFDGISFEDWVEKLVIPFFKDLPGKKCLIGDNLSSHLSVDLILKCKVHNIHFVFLPPNSTHLTQPLDVAFFRPMKRAWRHLLFKWKKTDGRQLATVPKGCFPKLLKLLIDELSVNSSSNIIAGFKKTGIVPLDIGQILTRLPDGDRNEDHRSVVTDSVLDLLKEMRYGSMNITEPTRKRRLNVIAGRSVSAEEIEDYTESDPSDENKKYKNKVKRARKNKNLNFKIIKEKENNHDNNFTSCIQIIENDSLQTQCSTSSRAVINSSGEYNTKKNKGKGIGKKTKTTLLKTKEIEEKETHNNNVVSCQSTENEIWVPKQDISQSSNLCHQYSGRTNKEHIANEMSIVTMPVIYLDDLCEEITISTEINDTDLKVKDMIENVCKINEIDAEVTERKKEIKTKKINIISEEILNKTTHSFPSKGKTVSLNDYLKLPNERSKHANNKRKSFNYYNEKDKILKILEDDSY